MSLSADIAAKLDQIGQPKLLTAGAPEAKTVEGEVVEKTRK